MSLISFSNVSKFYQSDLILDHISFSINKKEKVALIGNNGVGKTTIFKLILGKEEVSIYPKEDKPGSINILGNLKIGYLDQNAVSDVSNTVNEELLLCFKEEVEIENELKEISQKIEKGDANEKIFDRYNSLLKKMEELDGYNYQNQIDEMINRFGFDLSIKNRVISTLSGGERMKIGFIKILLFDYDLILLDEPTNHLDISTIEWLENYLKSSTKTIFFISHDRYFLEALTTKVIELDDKKTTTYNLDYNHYLTEKETRYESLLKESKIQEKEIQKLKRFIEYYKPKPRFTSRAKDKEKKLEKIEKNLIEVKKDTKKIKVDFKGSNLKNKKLLDVEDLIIGYNSPLCPPFSFQLYGKDKLAICGDNGIGKTTLIKTITSLIQPISGKVKYTRQLKFSYIQQNDYSFDNCNTPFDYIKNNYPFLLDKEVRSALGRFLFQGEDIFKNISIMSNGEKMRLLLCNFSLRESDILFLDEPTNHLDMLAKETIIEALNNYEGCIVFISHDRYFINSIANHILYLSRDRVLFMEGNYENLKKTLDRINENKELKTIDEIEHPKIIKLQKLSNNQILKYKDEVATIEKRIEEIDEELEQDFESYDKIDKLTEEKDELEFRYLELLEILEKDSKL